MSRIEVETISSSLRAAIRDSGKSYYRLAQESGVERLSIARFATRKRSMRLDMADKLATYFGLALVKKEK